MGCGVLVVLVNGGCVIFGETMTVELGDGARARGFARAWSRNALPSAGVEIVVVDGGVSSSGGLWVGMESVGSGVVSLEIAIGGGLSRSAGRAVVAAEARAGVP